MGNAQSQRQRPPFRPTSNGVYDGPLFGGHHAGDFSLARQPPVNCNKSVPEAPRNVHFGHQPPSWEFHKDAPTWDNTANTRYCAAPTRGSSLATQPPSSGGQGYGFTGQGGGQGQGMRVMNQ